MPQFAFIEDELEKYECTTSKTRDFVEMADDGFEDKISSFRIKQQKG